MILLALIVLLVAAIVAAGVGRTAFADPLRGDRPSRVVYAPIVAVAGVVLVLLVVVAPILLVGLRGASDERDEPGPAPPVTTVRVPASTTATSIAEPSRASRALGPVVRFGAGRHVIGELRPDTVLRVIVTGFEPFAVARAKQCIGSGCGNVIGVQFGENGSASFQYLVVDDFSPGAEAGGCRAGAPPCSLVVEHVDGDQRAAIVTLFHDPVPPPAQLTVEPRAGVLAGQRVGVTVRGAPAGARVELVLCALPATPARCGEPGPVVPLTIGAGGSATASIPVGPVEVGRDRVGCGGGGCAVALRSSSALLHAEPARFTFAAPPGVDYDGGRLVVAIGVALALLLLAVVLIRVTDWSPIGEEAAPEIDDAEYADLDAIVALLPPEEVFT